MSGLSDRIRKYVNDFDVSNEYGKWGILNRDQRRMIRRLCDLCDCFESEAVYLAAKLQEVRNNKSWISVKDRLPEKDTRVLVYLDIKDLNPYSTPFFDTDRILDGKWVRWNSYVTHWQPLPEPPKDNPALLKGGVDNAK